MLSARCVNVTVRFVCKKLVLASLITCIGGAHADQDLFSMSLEELTNVKVRVAARYDTSIRAAPATVHLFTHNEIRQLGVTNVYELLNRVPGFQVTRDESFAAVPLIHARGIASHNGYVLVLLNGERVNEISLGNATVYSPFLPTELVERVEIISGPGSALYGSNAYLGVMNIITRTSINEVTLARGNFGSKRASVLLHEEWKRDTPMTLTGAFYHEGDNGDAYKIDDVGIHDPRQHDSFYTTAHLGDFELFAAASKDRLEDFIQFGNADARAWFETENTYVRARHVRAISSATSMSTTVSFAQHHIEQTALLAAQMSTESLPDWLAGPYSQSTEYRVLWDIDSTLSDTDRLLAGLVFHRAGLDYAGVYSNYLSPDESSIGPDPEWYRGHVVRTRHLGDFEPQERFDNNVGSYLQFEHNWSDVFTSFFGLRYDDYELAGTTTNPRIALIYQGITDSTIKLQYGSAFRAPSLNEALSPASAIGSIQPELIETVELSWQRQQMTWDMGINYFYNELEDLIVELDNPENPSLEGVVNSGDYKNDGIEAELTLKPYSQLMLQANLTHVFSGVAAHTFRDFGSVGIFWNPSSWQAGLTALYRRRNPAAVIMQDSYALVDFNIQHMLSEQLELFVTITNVLDKRYVTHDLDQPSQGFIMPGRGRTVMFGTRIAL